MSKVAIVTDTNSGISPEEGKELGIYVMPMPFSIDGVDYKEGIDLSRETFFQKQDEDAEIFTSQPSVADLLDLWDQILKENDSLVYVPMSSGLSSSCQTALTFASEEPYLGKVFVANNGRISVTLRYCLEEAVERANAGWPAEEIRDFLEETADDASIYIMVDTLKFLKKGGRVTAAGAALATVLNLKPVLYLGGEKLDAFGKARGVKQAKAMMIKAILTDANEKLGGIENVRFAIAHTSEPDALEAFVQEVKEACHREDIQVDPLSLSVSCHIGRGSLAIAACKCHPL